MSMVDDSYLKLREFLNRFPLGFPETKSGIEIKILKRLFKEEEAKIVVLLNPFPETTAQIARRTGLVEEELEEKLDSMAKKGLIFWVQRKNKNYYNSVPFMIGLYEYSVKKIDPELAQLFKEYYETAYLKEMGVSNIPGFKVLPIEEAIAAETVLYPYQKLKESIKETKKISVTECICRKEARLAGHGCNYPLETCLSFGAAAEYYIKNGLGREVTVEEALKILELADNAGLIHAGVNAKHLSNLCNCCRCCCASMKGITKLGHDKHLYLNALFESIIDREKCINCGACIDRCPVGAITLEDIATVNREKCLGCGLCANTCPEKAIRLKLRDDGEAPYERVMELGMAILEGKRKTGK